MGLLLVYIWTIALRVSPEVNALCFALLAAVPIASTWLHRDRPRDLGIRLDTFGRSSLEVGAATAVALAVVLAIGAWAGSGRGVHAGTALASVGYVVWGFLQQYALQGFVHRRLREAWGRPRLAAAGAALLFGLVHYPNPVLLVSTTVGGFVWCTLFRRAPNLVILGISHGLLAAVLMDALPSDWVRSLRIGPGYGDF